MMKSLILRSTRSGALKTLIRNHARLAETKTTMMKKEKMKMMMTMTSTKEMRTMMKKMMTMMLESLYINHIISRTFILSL